MFHYPDTLELTEDQKTEQAKKKMEVTHSNTRWGGTNSTT